MPRTARLVIPGYPHHIIQRGNRRQPVFWSDDDRCAYLDFLRIYAKSAGIEFWAYCLMDNHIHLIAVPKEERSFAIGLADAHVRYTRMVNFKQGWRGYLWEGRFKSHPLSEQHLYAAIRYVERNPVRAKMVQKAEDYPWSSANAHVKGEVNPLLTTMFLTDDIKDWASYLRQEDDASHLHIFRKAVHTGRPLGDKAFIEHLEALTGKNLKKNKPGPKGKEEKENN